MKTRLALGLVGVSLLVAAASASTPLVPRRETINQALARARGEASAAQKRLELLEQAVTRATGATARLGAEQAAAAAAIEASEAQISAADSALHLARSEVALGEQRLARRRAPVASLLAGLATMARRPPLLALADGGSIEDMVRIRALLDATMPVIEQRSAALAAELAANRRMELGARAARDRLGRERALLAERRAAFVALERRAAATTRRLTGEAIALGDTALAGDDTLGLLDRSAQAAARARAAARATAEFPFAPPRPGRADAGRASGLAYSLPADAAVIEGLGAVSAVGITARGVTLATPRGAPLEVPADGVVRFAGPFRSWDGLVIIAHRDGWISLVTNLRPAVRSGQRVRRGEPLGQALGDIGVELREAGVPRSPALIAGSSMMLSNAAGTR
jgi:septal ring factor EnvC (AmiA/AmiB activator)